MADTSNSIPAPRASPDLFEERLASYIYARDRLEAQADDLSAIESNHYADAYLYAESLALNTPVSNLSDLRAKAEILWGDPDNTPNRDEIVPFLADLVRLTNHKPSRVFDARHWLARFEHAGGMWAVREGEVLILGPVGPDLSGLLDMLSAMDGAEAVKGLVRRRHASGLFGDTIVGVTATDGETV